MAAPAPKRAMTYAEYLEHEATSEIKHAFHDGEIFSMAGGTIAHGTVGGEAFAVLRERLRGTPCGCRAFNSDIRVSPSEDHAMYPDVTVACPPFTTAAWDDAALAEPILLVEVLSPSTFDWDLGGKFELYKGFASLKHYLVLHPDAWRVQHRVRQPSGAWLVEDHGPDDVITLAALGIEVSVAALYADLVAQGGPSRDAVPVIVGPSRMR